MLFFHQLAVFYHGHGDVVIQKAQKIQIERDQAFYLDDVLFAVFAAVGVGDDGHLPLHLVKLQHIVNQAPFAAGDMIDHITCFDSTDVDHTSGTSKPSKNMISAIRIYTPYCACLKYIARGSLSTSRLISFTRGSGCSTIIS